VLVRPSISPFLTISPFFYLLTIYYSFYTTPLCRDQIEDVEIRTQQALAVYNQSDKPNLTKLAREFGITRNRLRSRVAGH
jgi:hypothetical protein